ncbi:MAG TPA: VanW family protein [Candidatus Deferrimicrobium sp.]|nr:VanW family protein [Candidatus Deferrimicrobium sp.]
MGGNENAAEGSISVTDAALTKPETEIAANNSQEREVEMLEVEKNPGTAQVAKGTWVKHNKLVLIAASVLVLITASAGIALGVYTRDRGVINEGIVISGVPVGNLSKEEAASKVQEKVKEIVAKTIKFSVDGQIVELKSEELGLKLKMEEAIEQAYKTGREGSITQKATDKHKATQGISLALKPEWDDKKLIDALNTNIGKFNQPAQDASFTINSQNGMDIKDSKTGKLIDVAALASQVKAEDVYSPKDIKVEFKEEQPKLSRATLESQKITGLVSSYTSSLDASKINRTENVRVAAKALDGVVVKPGDTFSFNDVVGPRSNEAGYKDALVIVDGEFVPGLGGGICQVSSTFYNTLLLADLTIVERNNHSLAITYVPLGRDATVAYPSLDLKFKNDSGSYLLIKSKMQGNTLTFQLYGQPKPEREVTIVTSTIQTLSPGEQRVVDRNLAPGTQEVKQGGQAGYVVATTKIVKVNGQVTKKENLGNSRYQPMPRIIATGP